MLSFELAGRIRRGTFARDVIVEAPAGAVVGLLGGLGSGKSTLLDTLAGIVPLDAGHLRAGGRVWDDPAHGVFVAPPDRPVAHLPLRPALLDDVPAVEQVVAAFPAALEGDATAALLRRDAEALLEQFGLAASVFERDGWTLSGGETQRVALARCLTRSAPLLLLDDPFAALDNRARALVRDALSSWLRRRSCTTVVACADPGDTVLLADRIVDMS